MAVETAELASAEAIVGGFSMSVVCDHAVVASLSGSVTCNHGADVRATIALWHAARLLRLHLVHALLCLTHVTSVVIILVVFCVTSANHRKESFTLLSSSRLVWTKRLNSK